MVPQFRLGASQGIASTEYLLISGWSRRDASAARLDAAYVLTTNETPNPPAPQGNHCLRYSGAAGSLGQYCFDVNFTAAQSDEPLSEESFSLLARSRLGRRASPSRVASMNWRSWKPAPRHPA